MIKDLVILLSVIFIISPASTSRASLSSGKSPWSISALPSSVRLDPSTGKIIGNRPDIYNMEPHSDLRSGNWIYDGKAVNLHGARGEYVSFQLVITRHTDKTLKDIIVEMPAFTLDGRPLGAEPELFLEWAVEVKEHSTGYEKSTLGPGWYPDALIPLKFIQQDVSGMGRVLYPFELPDFSNRVDNQRHLIIWIDQFVPFERPAAAPGVYHGEITVRIGDDIQKLPVGLKVWDFAIPRENKLAANLQHEGFLSRMEERGELTVYQLFKRHRIVPADPTYSPGISITSDGRVSIDWTEFDRRLKKYFSGEAFTEKYGYSGPGYGEPIEQFVLPFDVYGKYGTPGWPDVGKPEVEREPERRALYIQAIRQVRNHILSMVNPEKTRLIVYLNGLDESYFPEAWDRMFYYGKMFEKYFPESRFRVDGSYSREAMEVIHDAIDYWCCHTIGYDMETIEAYRKLGVSDWFYGPMLYEREENGWCGSSTFIDLQLVNERAISWSCWKYRTLTWCSWGMGGSNWKSAWYNTETGKDYFRDHGTGPLKFRRYNGKALAVYAPGMVPRVNAPCPSLRLKTMRDGVEEYEFLRLLSELDGNRKRADAIVNKIIKRPFGKASIGNIDIWNYNPAVWDAARIKLGEMIVKTMAE